MLGETMAPTGDLLAKLPLFDGLSDDELACIRAELGREDIPSGATLFRPGDPCRGMHIVVSGYVKISLVSANGAEKVLELIGPGQTLGESAVFLDRPHKTSAETLCDSRLLHIAKDRVFAAVRNHPGFAQRIIAGLSHRLDRFVCDLESLTLHSGSERVVEYLLSCLGNEARRHGAALTLPASKGVIASRLSLTQEHFSRILHDLAAIDLIRVDGGRITIPDVAQLRARAV